MKTVAAAILTATYSLSSTCSAYAQEPEPPVQTNTSYDFVQGTRVVFQDDFSQDSAGRFPSRWRLYPTYSTLDISDSITNTGLYPIKVRKTDSGSYLAIASDNHYFPLKPKINRAQFLDDTFTVEFDFRMDDEQSDPAIVLFSEQGTNIFECRMLGTGEILFRVMLETPFSVDYPGSFRYRQWHHFALSCMHRQIKCYVDSFRVLVLPDCHTSPDNFIIAGNSYTEGNPIVAFRKIRLATSPGGSMFNKILTEKKFTTHAIYFQKGQSAIAQESMDFIRQLAEWLDKNPTIKLEIAGHTDNDGDPKTNLKLSNDRANAVLAALVALGIDKSRLTANGYGADKPIDTNDTAEGKAQNRRVEFIRS